MDADRFWTQVAIGGPDECWPWLGGCSSFGHGAVKFDGKTDGAHRVAWVLKRGPIPDGKCVLHSCDNPPCCNDAHLFLGTRADNIKDMIAKGRDRKASGDDHWARKNPPIGERNSRAILTELDVRAIRVRAVTENIAALAREYDLSEGATRHIIKRRNWKHVA